MVEGDGTLEGEYIGGLDNGDERTGEATSRRKKILAFGHDETGRRLLTSLVRLPKAAPAGTITTPAAADAHQANQTLRASHYRCSARWCVCEYSLVAVTIIDPLQLVVALCCANVTRYRQSCPL